ncbi:hypothetical protein FF011L_06030 [Roseimaritima multifibrata]|uniref:PEP-CTERM protein-sorting domain-containing protein n=1 Tax=Roseimaritima multifibrata TaxID=1930274 RepID=A0A517MAQ2_9BACT|nr:PEP-CTERM sorting domain-containing protein [Roseimaritima multifibrata]QDS91867.1 hypothetical protein FF011L_06030 [Roseimaritima multifibrata]
MRYAHVLLTGILMLAASTSQAGLIVLSGDSNLDDSGSNLEDFYANMFGGQKVFASPAGLTSYVGETQNKMIAAAGAANFTEGSLASGIPSGQDWVVAGGDGLFSNSEISLIADFFNAGGNVYLIGEGFNAPAENLTINKILEKLGSNMRLTAPADPAKTTAWKANAAEIYPNPLTAGIDYFGGDYSSVVTGGTPLFDSATTGETFIAVENLAVSAATVPEPTSLAILSVMGIAACGARRRSKRANAK